MTSPAVTVSPMTTDECSSSPMMMMQGRMNSTSSPCASSFRQEGSLFGSCGAGGAFPSVSPFTPVSPSASGGAYNHLLGRHGRSSFVPPAPTTTPVLASPNTPLGPRFAKAIEEQGEEEEPVLPPQSPVSTIAEDDEEEEGIDQHQEETESLHVSDDVSSQTEEISSVKSRSPRCRRTHKSKKSKKNKKNNKKSKQGHHPSVLSTAPAASTTFDGPNEELNNTFTGDDHQHEFEGKSSNSSPVEEEEEAEGTSRRRVEKNSIKIHTTTVLHHTNQQPEEQEMTSQSPQNSSSPAAKKKAKAPSCSPSHNNSFASIASSAAGPSMNSSSVTSSTFSTTTTSKVKVEVDARRGLEVGHPAHLAHLHNVQARCGQHFEGRISLGRIDRQFVSCPLERNYECNVFLSLENHAAEKDEQATLTKWRNDPYAFNVIPDPSLMMKVHAAQRDAILSSNSAMVAQVRQCFKPQISGINDRFQQQQQQKPHQWSPVFHHAEYNTSLNNDDGMCTVADSYAEEGQQEEDNYYPQDNYCYDMYHYPCHDVHTAGRSPSCYHRPSFPSSGLPEDQRLTSNCESHQVQAYRPASHLSITTTTTSTTSGGQDMLQSFRQRRHSSHELSAISLSDDNIKAASSVSPSSPYRTPPQTVPRQPSTAVGQPGSHQHLTQKRVMMSPMSASSFSQLSETGRSTWENGTEGLSRSSSIVSSTSMISPNHRTGGGGSWHTAGSYPRTTTPFQAGAYPRTASIPTNGRRRLMYDSFTPY